MKTLDFISSRSTNGHSRIKQIEGDRSTHKLSLQVEYRTDRDAIEISEDGQKVINLARANELGVKLPNAAKNPTGFRKALKQGFEDIKRITRLFIEVLTLLRRRR